MSFNDVVFPNQIVYGGHALPIFKDHKGGQWLFDPGFHVPVDHYHFPFYRNPYFGPGDSGPYSGEMGALTQTQQGGFAVAATAATFIPYAGPFIAAGIAIAGALLGQGDPTPIGKLWEAIISLRVQAANLRDNLAAAGIGQPDDFTVDPNIKADDPNTGGVLSAQITAEVLNMFPGDITNTQKLRSEVKRGMEYQAIAALQKQVADLSAQWNQVYESQQIKAGIVAALGQGTGTNAGGYSGGYVYDSSTGQQVYDYNTSEPGIQYAPPPGTPQGSGQIPAAPDASSLLSGNMPLLLAGGAVLAYLLTRK